MKTIFNSISNLIDHQKLVYVGAVDENGFPTTKAMYAPRKREGFHTFYLSTNTSSQKVSIYRKNPKASLYFCDRRFYRGVLLSGTMEVLEDYESKKMIWKKGDTLYYSQGVDDPDYCVLKFTAIKGRFYRSFHSEDFEIDSLEQKSTS